MGSGVNGIPVQGERIVFALHISRSKENKTEDTATSRTSQAITNAAEAQLNQYIPRWVTGIGHGELDRQTTKLAGAQRQLIAMIEKLHTTATFTVVVFAMGVRFWQKSLGGATEPQKESAITFLQQFSASGSMDALSALEQTFALSEIDQIIFISDGNPAEILPDDFFIPPDWEKIKTLISYRDLRRIIQACM
jgi:hypothetical protein